MAHDTASEAFLGSKSDVPNPSNGIESKVNDWDGVNMVFGSRGNCAVGLLADAAAMPAKEDKCSNDVENLIFGQDVERMFGYYLLYN
jgi:hypothetical protein